MKINAEYLSEILPDLLHYLYFTELSVGNHVNQNARYV